MGTTISNIANAMHIDNLHKKQRKRRYVKYRTSCCQRIYYSDIPHRLYPNDYILHKDNVYYIKNLFRFNLETIVITLMRIGYSIPENEPRIVQLTCNQTCFKYLIQIVLSCNVIKGTDIVTIKRADGEIMLLYKEPDPNTDYRFGMQRLYLLHDATPRLIDLYGALPELSASRYIYSITIGQIHNKQYLIGVRILDSRKRDGTLN